MSHLRLADYQFRSHLLHDDEVERIQEERESLIGWVVLLAACFFFIIGWYTTGLVLLGLMVALFYLGYYLQNEEEVEEFDLEEVASEVIITTDYIKVNDKIFPFADIKLTRFSCYDFQGRRYLDWLFGIFPFMVRSNGARNKIWFLSEDKHHRYHFIVTSKSDAENIAAIRDIVFPDH